MTPKKLYGILLLFLCYTTSLPGQNPGTVQNLNAPLECCTSMFIGIEGSLGLRQVEHLTYTGIRGSIENKKIRSSVGTGLVLQDDNKNSFAISTDVEYVLAGQFNTLVELLVQSGISYNKLSDFSGNRYGLINIPFGIGIGLNGPTPKVDINIWASLRGQWRANSLDYEDNDIGFGLNTGLSLTPSGKHLGIYLGFDYLNIELPDSPVKQSEMSIGLGIRYLLKYKTQ